MRGSREAVFVSVILSSFQSCLGTFSLKRSASRMPRSRMSATKKPVQWSRARLKGQAFNTCGATFAWFLAEPTHERAITHSASNAGSRSRYSASRNSEAFPLSLGDPFTYWRSAGISAAPALCKCPIGLTFASTVSSYSIGTVLYSNGAAFV